MHGTDPPTGFAWLAPHDAARRDAGVLFGVALAVLGFYSFGVFALVVLVAEASAAGTADRLASFDIGTVVAVGAIGIACVTAAEDATLKSYQWVDRNAGVVRIPIDEAIKLTLQRGLPSRVQATETSK